MPSIFDAIAFAARAHAGQYRKGTHIPYLIHPLSVARILIECDAPEEVVLAGVLHDVVEDTPATLAEVRAEFGPEVARLVEALSEPDRNDTWENRKRDTLEFLKTAPPEVLWIEVADKLDNIRGIRADYDRHGDAIWTRFNRGRDRQKWYHTHLAALFLRLLPDAPYAELAREFAAHVRAVFAPSDH